MSKIQILRDFVSKRLTVATEEIFGLFERTIAEYEKEISRSRKVIENQRKQLDLFVDREHEMCVDLHTTEPPPTAADVSEEHWSPVETQEDPGPQQIKEEMEELWATPVEHQLGLEKAACLDEISITLTPLCVNQHQAQCKAAEWGRAGCGASELTSDSQPISSDASKTEDSDDGEGWKDGVGTGAAHLKPMSRMDASGECHSCNKPALFACKACGQFFSSHGLLAKHAHVHAEDSSCVCGLCGMHLDSVRSLEDHISTHKRSLDCYVCGKQCTTHSALSKHLQFHQGLKPFSCSLCGKRFRRLCDVKRHAVVHNQDKPYCCDVCGKSCKRPDHLKSHIKTHVC